MAKKTWEMTRAEKLEYLKEIADNAIERVSIHKSNWREFLKFYSNIYTYPFSEVLTIQEQAPHFTACAEFNQWKKRGRGIQGGVHGIPVLNESTGTIKFLFDVADTYGDERGLPNRPKLPEKYKSAVVNELRKRFEVNLTSGNESNNIKWAVEEYVRAESLSFMGNLRYNVDGSYLEELDDDNLRREFEETVVDSVGYLVCERLGIEKGLYESDELSFQFLHEFNTHPALSKVGETVNHISRNVLNLVFETIKREQKLEETREKTNGSLENEQAVNRGTDEINRQSDGAGIGTESESGRRSSGDREIRNDVSELLEGELSGTGNGVGVGDDIVGYMRESERGRDGNDVDGAGTVESEESASERGFQRDTSVRNMDTGDVGGNSLERDSLQVQVKSDQSNEAESDSSPLSSSTKIYYNSDKKPFDVGMGHLGNGITVWNRLEEIHGDYKTIAHISSDRTVKYYDDNLPPAVREMIEKEARTSQMTISATQDNPVFSTPPQTYEPSKDFTFEYGGYHFTPYLQLTENGIDPFSLAVYMKSDETIGLSTDNNNYSHASFYNASPLEDYDVFLCEENGKLYIPANTFLFEYSEELHNSVIQRVDWLSGINRKYPNSSEINGAGIEQTNESETENDSSPNLNNFQKTNISENIEPEDNNFTESITGMPVNKAVIDTLGDRIYYANSDDVLYISNGSYLMKTNERNIDDVTAKVNSRRPKNKAAAVFSESLLERLNNAKGIYELSEKPYEDEANSKKTVYYYTDKKQYFAYDKQYADIFSGDESRLFVDDNSSYDVNSHSLIVKDRNNEILGIILPVKVFDKDYERLADILPLEVKWKSELERIKENPANDPYIGKEFYDGTDYHIISGIINRDGVDKYSAPNINNGEVSGYAMLIPVNDIENQITLWESNRIYREKQRAEDEIKAQREAEIKAEYENTNGYADNFPPMKKANTLRVLNESFPTKNYGNLKAKQFIEAAVKDGKSLEINKFVKKKYAEMGANQYINNEVRLNMRGEAWGNYRTALNNIETSDSPNAIWLKENHPFLHYKIFNDIKILDESFLNTEYRLNMDERAFYVIPKTAYDYGSYLVENADFEKQRKAEISSEPITILSSEESAENPIPESDDQIYVEVGESNKLSRETDDSGYVLHYEILGENLVVLNYANYDPDEIPPIVARIEADKNIIVIDENLPESGLSEIKRVAETEFDEYKSQAEAKMQKFLDSALKAADEWENAEEINLKKSTPAVKRKVPNNDDQISLFGDNDDLLTEKTHGTDYFTSETNFEPESGNPPLSLSENVTPSPKIPKPDNYKITDDNFALGSAKTKFARNVMAILTLKQIEEENRYATPDEQETLSRYIGWGGMPQAFDSDNQQWRDEYKELQRILTDDEYSTAKGSTLNAHYTSPEVIHGIYAALERMGFKGGNILEPALGAGNFYGCMPDEIAGNSRLYGVELDSITGRIATQLYPNANVQIRGFETANLQDNFFDAAVSNVPFGSYKLNDPKFDKYNLLIHDYFFCKTLDKIRPGGVIAFITSKGTLDKANVNVRRYIAERAELLGAVRLPNTAFKSNAGTEVTSDIIFLKKRDRLAETENEKWIYTGKTDDGIPLNEYYLDNPQMMLGTMAFDDRLYGGGKETTLNPDNRALDEALREAVNFLPENIYEASINFDEAEENIRAIPADPTIKNFCYTVIGGEIYQRNNSIMEKCSFPQTQTERVKSLIELRVLTRNILESQLEGINDAGLQGLQRELNQKYDAFVKKCGAINSKFNNQVFGNDADFPLLSALEDIDENGKIEKASIFTKRTITKDIKINHVDTSIESLTVCLNELGYVDILYMAELANKKHEDIINDLRGIIFKNPALDEPDGENNLLNGWETADEYLSGRVKEKLLAAEVAAKDNSIYQSNIEYLKQVQPKPLEAHEISARIGAHWVNASYYRQFLIETLKASQNDSNILQVSYAPKTGSWHVEKPYSRYGSIEATQVYGTKRMDAYALFELTLNQKSARIYDKVTNADGKEKRVLNQRETIAIREKQSLMKQEFKRWIFDDPDRRERLCAVYNSLFNSESQRVYDGSHLTFPGMSNEIKLRAHQINAVARILYGGNTLLAHEVGAGKTYTMAAAAMELKRIGMAKKPCFVVPNHLVGQWANEFKKLYPTANILAATKKDFEKQNRKRFCARIATGEWDAVIIGHSSFEKVPISRERQENRLKRDIEEVESALTELKKQDKRSLSVKDLERTLKNLEYELKRLQDSPKDNVVTFEELGVDNLFVDEAHYYKNKFIFTKMNNVAGLSRARAKKSTDMDIKCEYINEMNNSQRGVIFATGTPISNSMVEMYTMQSYLQRKELERLGLNHFDNWAADFGEVVSALELAASGQGYRVRERFAKFVGLPELMNMFGKIADIQTSEMMKLPVPEIRTGKPVTIAVEPSPELKEYTQKLVERAERIHSGAVKSHEDNMLCVTGDGRNAALDMRIIDPNAADYPDNKVNICAKKVFEIYEETKAQKSAQMIFCDISTPKGDGSFNVYDDIKEKLLYNGVNENEISFIHDADTDEKKEKLFAKVRSGEVRILIGSTQKMGAGTNAQTRLIALHHLDCPYRPSDLSQREGRIVRQGNKNPEVQIYQYVTKQSFDAYLWQIVESKAKFIAQVMSGKNPSREMEDLDETVLNYGEVKAIASGNPLIKRKLELDIKLQTLQTLETQHRSNKYSLETAVLKKYPQEISNYTETIRRYEADIILRDKHADADFSMTIGKTSYDERKDAGAILLKLIESNQYNDKVIGVYKGFEIIPQEQKYIGDMPKVWLKGALTHSVELSGDNVGSIMRIENRINKDFEKILEEKKIKLGEIQNNLESAKVQLTRPFEREDELKAVLSELSQVNMELDVDRSKDDVAAFDDEEENDDENENSKESVSVKDDTETEEFEDDLEVN